MESIVEPTANPADRRSIVEEIGGARSRATREGGCEWEGDVRNRETEKRGAGNEAAIGNGGRRKRTEGAIEAEYVSELAVSSNEVVESF